MDLPCFVSLGLHLASKVLRISYLVFGRFLGAEGEQEPTKKRRKMFPVVFGWCWWFLQANEKQGLR